MKKIYAILLFLIYLQADPLHAQTLPVGVLDNITDSVRRAQLLGLDSSNNSFMIRPVTQGNLRNYSKELYRSKDDKISIAALPIQWQQQFNSQYPYGMNDGGMVPAKGYQTMVSAGLFARIGFVSIQLQPEFVYAENKAFKQITDANNEISKYYYQYYNQIDLPDRFGEKAYTNFNWGQSSIRVNFDPVSFGISNENLWWGPGVRNSLLMSNNAPGFKHFTLNTSRPVNTPIGAFEAQIIAGRLESSGVALPAGANYIAKTADWRYISGVVFTYNPKWLPKLYLGFDRTFIAYHQDMGSAIKNYLPFFNSMEQSKADANGNVVSFATPKDQLASFFVRWVMPESRAEVYFQYGREDHAYNTRDFVVEPEHTRAYVVGFRKLLPLKRTDEYIQVGLELTQLESGPTKSVRGSGYWYTHSVVRDGYTNVGQVLGAGIGPGSNMQSLDVSWVKGLKKIGLEMERLVHNNDLMYNLGALDYRRHWVDLGLTGKFSWEYKRFILNSGLTYTHAFNQYNVLENGQGWFFVFDHTDADNLRLQAGITYRL